MAGILTIALNPTIDISCDADRVEPIHKIRTHNQQQYAGGGGTNVARVIAELGGTPDLLYLAGGASGRLYSHFMEAYAIRCHRFDIEGDIRIALMVHEEATGLEYRFVPEGPVVGADELEPALAFVERSDAGYVVASGSLPMGVPADTYARMAQAVERRGARFVLDTSGEALQVTLARARVFLFKPSHGELQKLVGRKLEGDDVASAAMEFVTGGAAENVAVTLGRNGAVLVNGDGVLRLPPVDVETRSAVGAGDSFTGAMIWWLSQGHSIAEAFRFGAAAGAAAVLTTGTELCLDEKFENAGNDQVAAVRVQLVAQPERGCDPVRCHAFGMVRQQADDGVLDILQSLLGQFAAFEISHGCFPSGLDARSEYHRRSGMATRGAAETVPSPALQAVERTTRRTGTRMSRGGASGSAIRLATSAHMWSIVSSTGLTIVVRPISGQALGEMSSKPITATSPGTSRPASPRSTLSTPMAMASLPQTIASASGPSARSARIAVSPP
jgi:6-phosphofructokinase 2